MKQDFRVRWSWRLAAPPAAVHAALVDVGALQRWWPGVRRSTLWEPGQASGLGARAEVDLLGLIPLTLNFNVLVTEVEHPLIIGFSVCGHLEGQGRWQIASAGRGSVARCNFEVRLRHPMMMPLTPALRPLYHRHHNRVMARGAAGLDAFVAQRAR